MIWEDFLEEEALHWQEREGSVQTRGRPPRLPWGWREGGEARTLWGGAPRRLRICGHQAKPGRPERGRWLGRGVDSGWRRSPTRSPHSSPGNGIHSGLHVWTGTGRSGLLLGLFVEGAVLDAPWRRPPPMSLSP